MDIGLLKTFIEVSKTRNFTRAADNLYVTSAAVSARIKQLEIQLGVELFTRHRGNMQLTNEGERLVPLAESMITTWLRALQEVSRQAEPESSIYVGASTSLWQFALNQSVSAIIASHPDIRFRAEGHSNEDLMLLLLDRSLDLVILPDPPLSPGIITDKIGEITLVLAATKEVSVESAMGENYIFIDWGSAFVSFHTERFGGSQTRVQSNFPSLPLDLLNQQGGAAYLPKRFVKKSDWLTRVKGAPIFKRAMYACYQEANARLDLIRSIVTNLKGISV